MKFEQGIAWAEGRASEVVAETLRTAALVERLQADVAYATGKAREKLEKELKEELRRLALLPKAERAWRKLDDIWRRGEKAKLKVSFSGGKTSAYMSKRIKDEWGNLFDILFVFANTSREHSKTLLFVDNCDREYGLNVNWVEALINHEGYGRGFGTTHREVSFKNASRLEHGDWNPDGFPTPFLDMVRKYGIPNQDFEPCNRELKLHAMDSFMASVGWNDYFTAIGLRSDETKRLDEVAGAFQIMYPLAQLWESDKQDVADFSEDQPFQLGLDEEDGNCVECHKKHKPKLFKVYAKTPEVFDFDIRIEAEFAWHGAPYYGVPTPGGKPRVRWRGHQTTEQFIAEARALGVSPHIPIKDMRSMTLRQQGLDFEGGCSESCEAFPMEMLA